MNTTNHLIDPTLDPATDASLRAASALMDAILPVMHLPPATITDELHAIAHDGNEQAARECTDKVKVAELAPLMRELGDVFAWRSPPDQATADALAAVKRATERNFWRRPLVMHFDGEFRDDDLKRRFEIVGLRAYATATGEVHVRETPVSSKRMHLEAMRAEILRLEREIADDEAQYVEDERATGDEK